MYNNLRFESYLTVKRLILMCFDRIFICSTRIRCYHVHTTAKMRQLVVDRRICCCSQFMIFLLELLGQAIGCLAGPSSSNRKIMD